MTPDASAHPHIPNASTTDSAGLHVARAAGTGGVVRQARQHRADHVICACRSGGSHTPARPIASDTARTEEATLDERHREAYKPEPDGTSARAGGAEHVKRTAAQRRRDRFAGIDRFGRPLPRALGTNPRALIDAAATVADGGNSDHDGAPLGASHRVPRALLDRFARAERITCFRCKCIGRELAAGGWREASDADPSPSWVVCVECVRNHRRSRKQAA